MRPPHLTTRLGFITFCGFGVVALYGLWAIYGAVPTSLRAQKPLMPGGAMEMGVRDAMDSHMPVEEFQRLVKEFVDTHMLADGSVSPALPERAATNILGAYIGEPVDVFMTARQYNYWPSVLRLERNVPYRFRIMAVDTDHGASIQFKGAAYMIRAPVDHMVEKVLLFKEPGEYPIYCTVYCGLGHDLMKGKIVVE